MTIDEAVIALVDERDKLKRDLAAVDSALDDWDWAGLVRDAEAGDFDSAVDALRTIARLAEARKDGNG